MFILCVWEVRYVCNNNGLQGKPGGPDRITAYKIISFHSHNIQTAGSSRAGLSPRNLQVLFKEAPCMLLLVTVFQAVTVEHTWEVLGVHKTRDGGNREEVRAILRTQ